MSLNRFSYLESWERNPAARFRRREQASDAESDEEDETHQDLPEEPSLSSSFPSVFDPQSLRHRLSFNPVAGPGWNQSAVGCADPERQSLLSYAVAPSSRDAGRDSGSIPEPNNRQRVQFKEPEWPVPESMPAFEVSRGKRIAQVILAVTYCFLSAGIVFGFAAFKPILIREGVYRSLCSREELREDVTVCYGQEVRLNLMFTIAAVATNVSALPVGALLDSYGPRVNSIVGSACLTAGALLLAFAANLSVDVYIPAYFFLSLGGPFIFISSFHLSNTFPTRSGLILSLLTGAFDASSAVFLAFRLLNERTNGWFSISRFFSVYLIVPLFILIVQVSVMPATSYKTAGELVQDAAGQIADEAHDRVDRSISDPREGERQRNDRREHRQKIVSQIQDFLDNGTAPGDAGPDADEPISSVGEVAVTTACPSSETHSAGGVWGAMHGYSALQQIRSAWFILITLFTVLQMLRINYFVASIRQQYEYLLSSPQQARRLNEIFDLLLPLGGLVSVPFIGLILDNVSTASVLSLLVTVATLIGILGCIPHSMMAGYANIVLFALYRPFYYTAVSDYAAKVFGFHTFGKVYGLIICLAGLGNFAQAGLDTLTFKTFRRDPVPVNVGLTGLACLVGVVLVGFVAWRARELAKTRMIVGISEVHVSGGGGNSNLVNGHSASTPSTGTKRDHPVKPLISTKTTAMDQSGPASTAQLSYGTVS